MKRISLKEFSGQSNSFDAAVLASGEIDLYCSSSDWVLPAVEALMPVREPWLYEDTGHYWAFMRGQHAEGFSYLEPLEAMWALACPAVGGDASVLAAGLEQLCRQPLRDWRVMLMAGLPAGHPLLAALVRRLEGHVRFALGDRSGRLIADLEDGMEAYLARRSKSFRRSLRRAQSKAREAGITIEDASKTADAKQLFSRIVDVEKRAWKGRDSVGIAEGSMHDFYELMMPRLVGREALQLRFATQNGRDLGYILGGLQGNAYRGLQFSYDADCAEFGLGNILQAEQLAHCAAIGAHHYDLGMSMDYKRRWSDWEHFTMALFLIRE